MAVSPPCLNGGCSPRYLLRLDRPRDQVSDPCRLLSDTDSASSISRCGSRTGHGPNWFLLANRLFSGMMPRGCFVCGA